jgi:hypothetical protein
MNFLKLVFKKTAFKNKIFSISNTSLTLFVIDFTFVYFTYIVNVKGGDLLLNGF